MKKIILSALLILPLSAWGIGIEISDIVVSGGASIDIRPLSNTWTGAYNDFSKAGEIRLSSGPANRWSFRAVGVSTMTLRAPLLAETTFYFVASGNKLLLGLNVEPHNSHDLTVGSLYSTDTIKGKSGEFKTVDVATLTATEKIECKKGNFSSVHVTKSITVNDIASASKGIFSQTETSILIATSSVKTSTLTADTVQSNEYKQGGQIGHLVPAGGIIISLTTCPAGWTEVTATRGLYLVGVPSGGSVGANQGTPITDLENRSHNHSTISVGTHTASGVFAGSDDLVYGAYIAPYIQVRLCRPI